MDLLLNIHTHIQTHHLCVMVMLSWDLILQRGRGGGSFISSLPDFLLLSSLFFLWLVWVGGWMESA